MSCHETRVIRIDALEKHPGADKLELVRIGGWCSAVALGQFKPGDLALFIEPDYVIPEGKPQFAFLGDKRRIKSRKLRGLWSHGLLMPVSDFPELKGVREGDNVMEKLGITRWEPPQPGEHRPGRSGNKGKNSDAEKPHPSLAGIAVYDLENLRKHEGTIEEGEFVVITEKLHGQNARYAWRGGRLWAGSRTQWRKSGEKSWWQKLVLRTQRWWRGSTRPNTDVQHGNTWWRVLQTHEWIAEWCRNNPDCVLFGEIYGDVRDLKYGAKPGELFFRAFDVMRDGKFVDAAVFAGMVPEDRRVPVLYTGAFNRAHAEELALRDSAIANHMSEGVVVKPIRERVSRGCGRVALKLVSDRYLARNE